MDPQSLFIQTSSARPCPSWCVPRHAGRRGAGLGAMLRRLRVRCPIARPSSGTASFPARAGAGRVRDRGSERELVAHSREPVATGEVMSPWSKVFELDRKALSVRRAVAFAVVLAVVVVVLEVIDQQEYVLTIVFAVLFVAAGDPGGEFRERRGPHGRIRGGRRAADLAGIRSWWRRLGARRFGRVCGHEALRVLTRSSASDSPYSSCCSQPNSGSAQRKRRPPKPRRFPYPCRAALPLLVQLRRLDASTADASLHANARSPRRGALLSLGRPARTRGTARTARAWVR